MAGSLTAEFEGLQAKVTATLQSIDANFSRANDLAAEMFPLVRDFVKQLASADEASATWHDAFLDVAGLKEAPEDTGAAANDGEQSALPPATPAAKTPSRFAGAGDATPDLAASDLSSVRPGTASRGPPRRDGLTLFSPPVSTPFLRPARTPGHVSGYERGSLVRGDPLVTPPASGRPAPGALTAADLDTSPTGSPAGEIASPGADAGDDDVAPSPELASPEMPTISCRAASLISALDGPGVWSVVGSPLDPSDPVASSAGEVSEALSRQGVGDVSPRRAESLLALLESEGFLRSFRDGDTRRWRAFSDEE
ncbi:hypothetical protein FNF27_03435 [Cafeteria roenbergensis]|uniref:Uncharacterized protein n=1 Tax=Cafeteria roenbergensis TaxID=33653 RepID=A0A5A8EEJ7_CAFRO|nr:hypothetical protein FNF27_03435 [Cafeteria roenbergensis]